MLGRHEEGLCDCRATTVFLNGNNVQVAGDLVPRTLPCRLDARLEEPETRTFDFDPIAAVREDRGKYLGAIFTIVRAFMAAKCPRPPDMHSVAGFEAWSQFVQQPLMWLGMADPYGNITRMRAADHTLDELRTLLKVLSDVFNAGDTFTVAKCKTLSNQHLNLRELMNFKGQLDTKAFGRLLGRYQGRTRDGWSYQATDTLSDGYIVYKLEGPSGEKRM
jgi:hypothetical protein